MSFQRGKFGIEYNPRPVDEDSPGVGWIVAAIAVSALTLVAVAAVRRARAARPAAPPPRPAAVQAAPRPAAADAPPLPPAPPPAPASRARPQVAQNLLLKLERAQAARDVELAVSTLEQLRALPPDAVGDIEDDLARQLGALNVRRLFVDRNRQWVTEVTVRRGDIASRIAAEHGATLASLLRLNALPSADRLQVNQRLYVLDHPKFRLVVHRSKKSADLFIKGRFFRRYDVIAPVRAEEGEYETPANLRSFLSAKGIAFSPADRAEL